MFEQNNETTSPPSRGRSPAGSVTSDGSRPYSKVRTSFISVERSGQLGSSSQKMSNVNGNVGVDGSNEPPTVVESSNAGLPTESTDASEPISMKDLPSEPGAMDSNDKSSEMEKPGDDSTKNESLPVDKPAASPDKPVAGSEDPSTIVAADQKEETADTEGAGPENDSADLGSVLKGSPFVTTTERSEEIIEPKTNPDLGQDPLPSQSKSGPSTRSEEPVQINGRLKEPGSTEIKSPLEARKAKAKAKAPVTRLSTTDKKKDTISTPEKVDVKSPKTPPKTPQKTPQNDGPTISVSSGPPARSSLERRSLQNKPLGNAAEKPKTTPAQAVSSEASKLEPSKPRQSSVRSNSGPKNKSGPNSPIHKPRPKSPTRPVRLPASATAPTASSAAKLGGAPPSRSPSRASISSSYKPSTINKNRPTPMTSATAQSRQKPVRSSLPPQSGAAQRQKPRASTASATGTDGGFLARMMRPTESSRSKAHDKAEVKSPPRKTARPKHKSGATDDSEKDKGKSTGVAEMANGEAAEAPRQETAADPKDEGPAKEDLESNQTAAAPVEPVQ